MWKATTCFIVILALSLMFYATAGHTISAFQKRDKGSAAPPNPYSKLDENDLTQKTNAFVKDLRLLNEDFRKAINRISNHDPDLDSKLKPIQEQYDRRFAVQARDLEKELLKRLGKETSPKDPHSQIASALIKEGQLAGADPPETIASYIEGLLAQLPHRAAVPRK